MITLIMIIIIMIIIIMIIIKIINFINKNISSTTCLRRASLWPCVADFSKNWNARGSFLVCRYFAYWYSASQSLHKGEIKIIFFIDYKILHLRIILNISDKKFDSTISIFTFNFSIFFVFFFSFIFFFPLFGFYFIYLQLLTSSFSFFISFDLIFGLYLLLLT